MTTRSRAGRNTKRRWFALATGLSGLAAVAACSSNENPGLATGATGGKDAATQPSSISEAGGGEDAIAIASDAAAGEQPAIDTLCALAGQEGKAVQGSTEPGAMDVPMGGTFHQGTYTLTQLVTYLGSGAEGGVGSGDDDDDDDDSGAFEGGGGQVYTGEAPTGVLEQKTLVVAPQALFSLAAAVGSVDAGLGTTQVTAGVYKVSGSSVVLQATCPAAGAVTYMFTATANLIELFEPNGVVELYRLSPGG